MARKTAKAKRPAERQRQPTEIRRMLIGRELFKETA